MIAQKPHETLGLYRMKRRCAPLTFYFTHSVTSLFLVVTLLVCSHCSCRIEAQGFADLQHPCHHDGSESERRSPTSSSAFSTCCATQIVSTERSLYHLKEARQHIYGLWHSSTPAQLVPALHFTTKIFSGHTPHDPLQLSNRLFSISAPRGPPLLHL